MPFGKSQDEKDAELAAARQAVVDRARARTQAERAAADTAAETAFPSPLPEILGRAQAARQRGDTFFEAQLDVSVLEGRSMWGSSAATESRNAEPADLLGRVEALGWHLEHVGYVYVETGSTSTHRPFTTGDGTVSRGSVRGIYLFRAVASPEE